MKSVLVKKNDCLSYLNHQKYLPTFTEMFPKTICVLYVKLKYQNDFGTIYILRKQEFDLFGPTHMPCNQTLPMKQIDSMLYVT